MVGPQGAGWSPGGICSEGTGKSHPCTPSHGEKKPPAPQFNRTKIFIDFPVTATTGESFSTPKHLLEETVKKKNTNPPTRRPKSVTRIGRGAAQARPDPPLPAPQPPTQLENWEKTAGMANGDERRSRKRGF